MSGGLPRDEPPRTHAFTRVRLADGREAIVKRLADPDHAPGGAAERLSWEGECLTRLSSAPNILRCHRVERAPPALVLEYAGAGSLAALLAAGASPGVARVLPAREAGALGAALAAAVAAVHAAGLVHRDVKPSNILLRTPQLTRPDAARLADFGVAAHAGSCGTLGDGWTEDAVGTLGYAAPEQLADPATAVHPAADVYALGVVLYELATGRLPHELAPGDEEAALRARVIAGARPTPPVVHRPSLAPAIDGVLRRALAYDPARRPSAAELGRAWVAACGDTRSDAPAQPPSSATTASIPGQPSRL